MASMRSRSSSSMPRLGMAVPQARKAVRREIGEAPVWLWRQPPLRFFTLVTAGRTLVIAGLYLLVVVVVREHGASALAIGLIFTLGACGGLASSFVAARIHSRFKTGQLLLGTTLLSLVIFGAYAAASNNAPLAALTALFYAVDTLYVVTTASYSAAITPDELRGRVVSLTRLVALGSHSLVHGRGKGYWVERASACDTPAQPPCQMAD